MFTKIKRKMKMYYKKILEENKNNSKKCWSVLHQALGKLNSKSSFPKTFLINNSQISDTREIAEGFNNFFSNIGFQTSHNVPQTNKHFSSYMPNKQLHSMFLEQVEPSDVISSVNKLKPKSSSGHDGFSTKILKDTIENIIEPITYIVNQSFNKGVFPDEMKIAKVIPIYKTTEKNLLKNYRPVSLLPAFSKLLEKLMYTKLMAFLTKNNILYKHQYGFRPKHCTVHPIMHLLSHCANASSKPEQEFTLAVLCDLSKAFDVINHEILLEKLKIYGIRGIVNDWFKSYLSERSQFVEIDNIKSQKLSIKCGVPQGSILGPLLYLIYVNDIGRSGKANILSFADDTTLYLSGTDLNKLYGDANKQINNLFEWFCSNKLSLNAKKTKYIVIRPKYLRGDLGKFTILINDIALDRIGNDCKEKSVKFLGINLDENLTWKYHITQVNKKVSSALFSIKQVKHVLPIECLKTLYYSLINSHFSYGILAWGNADKTTLKRFIMLQKSAIRVINRKSYNSHTDPLFKTSNILKIRDLFEYQSILFMFDYLHNSLPMSFDKMFFRNSEFPNARCTRQSNLFNIPRSESCFAYKLPQFVLPTLWNKWARSFHNDMTRPRVKQYIKGSILDSYLSQVTCNYTKCFDCNS
jgi:hypothetical protein